MNPYKCKNVNVFFGGVAALKNIELDFPENGITAVIGPNGAGKTTLFNVMTGFLKPSSGSCYLGDVDVTARPAYKIARLGVARSFQNLRLNFEATVMENLLLAFPRQRGESLLNAILRVGVGEDETHNSEKATELLRLVGLEKKIREAAGGLSYGQQKLLGLACCLATGARTLLLDEPVAGVAPTMIEQFLGVLRRLKNDKFNIIFIEHDLSTVRRVADTVIVMSGGRVIAQGSPEKVLNDSSVMEAYFG